MKELDDLVLEIKRDKKKQLLKEEVKKTTNTEEEPNTRLTDILKDIGYSRKRSV
jgi:hypothetical protein